MNNKDKEKVCKEMSIGDCILHGGTFTTGLSTYKIMGNQVCIKQSNGILKAVSLGWVIEHINDKAILLN